VVDGKTTSTTSRSVDGDPAFWAVRPGETLSPTSSSFTAVVSRLGCGGGVTGRVLRPAITVRTTEIAISFAVERLPDDVAHTCRGNEAVAYQIDLGERIGVRQLVDGQCAAGQLAASTAVCADAGVRWRPPAA
jgi:hypothetical protein